jgi:hypoxanthine phosphoribosyltransferase
MLPTKVFQIDYQGFGNLVWDHFDLIEKFQDENHIKFKGVVSKLRNGTIPGAIIANHLGIPMGVIDAPRKKNYESYELFLPKEIRLLDSPIELLYVDSICGTGETLSNVNQYFQNKYNENIKLTSYATLVDIKSKTKPDICGLVHTKFFQPPWEWRAFTPETHLDRLMNNDIKSSQENYHAIGICSNQCKDGIEQYLGQKLIGHWIEIFDADSLLRKTKSASGISSLDIPEKQISLTLCKTKFLSFINEKVEFIQNNGLTHFIETDFSQAILISEKAPICHVLFFDGEQLIKIYGREMSKKSFISLNF